MAAYASNAFTPHQNAEDADKQGTSSGEGLAETHHPPSTSIVLIINIWVHLKKFHQNRVVPQNAYSLKLKSIRRAILYEFYSTKESVLGCFLLFNFQIDSALTFSSGLIYIIVYILFLSYIYILQSNRYGLRILFTSISDG